MTTFKPTSNNINTGQRHGTVHMYAQPWVKHLKEQSKNTNMNVDVDGDPKYKDNLKHEDNCKMKIVPSPSLPTLSFACLTLIR